MSYENRYLYNPNAGASRATEYRIRMREQQLEELRDRRAEENDDPSHIQGERRDDDVMANVADGGNGIPDHDDVRDEEDTVQGGAGASDHDEGNSGTDDSSVSGSSDESEEEVNFKPLRQFMAREDRNIPLRGANTATAAEGCSTTKNLSTDDSSMVLKNMARYLECIVNETGYSMSSASWTGLIASFDTLFRKLIMSIHIMDDITPILDLIISVLKIPGITHHKGILDPFSRVISHALRSACISFHQLLEMCELCHRNFIKDRERHFLNRIVIFELIQAMKFKVSLPGVSLYLLLQLILQDIGGLLHSSQDSQKCNPISVGQPQLNSIELPRLQIADITDFLGDVSACKRIERCSDESNLSDASNRGTLGGIMKCALARYLASELAKGNHRENRNIIRYLPWLYAPPTATMQGFREYSDCVGRIRLLSWLLLGSLVNSTFCMKNSITQARHAASGAQPIPQETSCHIADHVQIIVSYFPDQYRSSTMNISTLFHVFNLCQLWTIYLEEYSKDNIMLHELNTTENILLEFWSKVTLSILQVISQPGICSDIIILHFSKMLENVLEYGCTILLKLLPIWNLIIIHGYTQIPHHLLQRLQYSTQTRVPKNSVQDETDPAKSGAHRYSWLQRTQFRMNQAELQSSQTTQFYSL